MSRPAFVSVPSLEAFFGPPGRRYVVFRSFAYWQLERRVFGTIIWGRPLESDVAQMCAAHEVGANPLFRGHASMVDIRALESVDLLAFERLLGYLVQRREDWSPNVSRQAILHRGGYAHAVVAGMFQFLRPGHTVGFYDDARAAYAGLDASDDQEAIEGLREGILTVPDVARRVQGALDTLPPRVSSSEIARAVGMSTRSLQRHLMACGSSLRIERQKFLVRASERLLEGTDLDLAAIAAQVGVSSSSHLVSLFRTIHGVTPGAFRSARRGGTTPR